MLPQLRQDPRPAPADVAEGARRIVLGLFLKLVVADTLANGLRPGEGVSSGFDRVGQAWGGADVIVLALGFGLQLYFDFAGYSHVAIGSARLLGFRVRENFADPYLSRTPPAMWSRWHMSLSSWIRDYLFFPLALLRRGAAWRMVVVVLSMAVFGIWHGFRLTFLLWGVYQGLVQVGHRLGQQLGARWGIARRVPRLLGVPLSWGLTFGFVTLGWIFFRASSLGQAAGMLGAVLDPRSYLSLTLKPNAYLMIVAVLVGYLLVAALRSLAARWEDGRVASPLIDIALPAAYAALALLVLGWSRPVATFLYFQF
jgi:alginate O-acetyltransferase complex protein AlgI